MGYSTLDLAMLLIVAIIIYVASRTQVTDVPAN